MGCRPESVYIRGINHRFTQECVKNYIFLFAERNRREKKIPCAVGWAADACGHKPPGSQWGARLFLARVTLRILRSLVFCIYCFVVLERVLQ